MKNITKLLAVIMLVSFSIVLMSNKSKTLKENVYYYDFNFSSGDTISNNDTTYYINVAANKAEPLKYSVKVNLDSTSGTPTVTAIMYGRIFNTDAWTSLGDTVNWAGTSSDTTFTFTEVTTAEYYRYFRLYFDANTTAQKSTITDVQFKFWSS